MHSSLKFINFAVCLTIKLIKMNLLNFIPQYPDEQSCIARFKAQRDQNGVVCLKCNHIKMQILPDLKADTATKVVEEQLSYQSDIQIDDSTTYKKLNEVVQAHQAQVITPEDLPKVLPWVHILHRQCKTVAFGYALST